MMTLADGGDSKEIKIRRLNGWLRWAIRGILFLLLVGTIAGFLYWRRTVRFESAQKEARTTAVDLIVRGQKLSDSLDAERHRQIMERIDLILEMHRQPSVPEEAAPRLDTNELKKQLMEQKAPEEEK